MAFDDPKPIYPTKARYRVLETSFINGEIVTVDAINDTGPKFVEYDGHPGSNLEPADDEAKRRKAIYLKMKGRNDDQTRAEKAKLISGAFDAGSLTVPGGTVPPAVPPVEAQVEIPDDWRTWNAGRRVLLAAKLGAPETCDTAVAANDFIEAELARRAQSKAA